MTPTYDLIHEFKGSRQDLDSLVRYWEWEKIVRDMLPEVLRARAVATVFQPIFHLVRGRAEISGYEALARFPGAPRIPVGLWFRTANELGIGTELQRIVAKTAVDSCELASAEYFLNVNASFASAVDVALDVRPGLEFPLVLDLPRESLRAANLQATLDRVRSAGAGISIDDMPLDELHNSRPSVERARPRYLKVDVLAGLHDSPMGRFNLAEAAAWCRDSGIALIAERVQSPLDLELLHDLGVEMAQGYSLARPE